MLVAIPAPQIATTFFVTTFLLRHDLGDAKRISDWLAGAQPKFELSLLSYINTVLQIQPSQRTKSTPTQFAFWEEFFFRSTGALISSAAEEPPASMKRKRSPR